MKVSSGGASSDIGSNKNHKHSLALQWRHNEHDGVSNHLRLDCLLSRFFGGKSKNSPKPRVTGLFEGSPPVTGEFPSQRASNAEKAAIWWRHHEEFTHLLCLEWGRSSKAWGRRSLTPLSLCRWWILTGAYWNIHGTSLTHWGRDQMVDIITRRHFICIFLKEMCDLRLNTTSATNTFTRLWQPV